MATYGDDILIDSEILGEPISIFDVLENGVEIPEDLDATYRVVGYVYTLYGYTAFQPVSFKAVENDTDKYAFRGTEVTEEVSGNDYYLYNIATEQFLVGANDWGTRASLNDVGIRFTVTVNEDGTVMADSHIMNSATAHYLSNHSGGYLDWEPCNLQFELVSDAEDGIYVYTIAAADETSKLLAFSPTGDKPNLVEFKEADASDPTAQWMLVSKSDRLRLLAKASPENPVDATFMISGSNFSRNDAANNAWDGAPTFGGDNVNFCAEKWNTNFDVNQVVKYIPAGQYELSVQGFYRPGSENNELDANVRNAILYANGEETPLMNVLAEAKDEKVDNYYPTAVNGGSKYIAQTMDNASRIFLAGGYADNKVITTVYDLTLKLGIKKDVAVQYDWTIFDNFRLKYLGYDEPTTVAAAAKALAEKVKEAKAIESEVTSDGVALIENAIKENNKEYETSWEYAIAVNEIQDAIDKATANYSNKNLPGGDADAINDIMAGTSNHDIYDLSGRKVAKVQKGIYIIDGKKVAVK